MYEDIRRRILTASVASAHYSEENNYDRKQIEIVMCYTFERPHTFTCNICIEEVAPYRMLIVMQEMIGDLV